MNDILPCVDCEVVRSEAIAMTEGNDVKHPLTFLIVGDFISACRRVHFIANLWDRHDVDVMFNEGVYMWVLKIVTDGQFDQFN